MKFKDCNDYKKCDDGLYRYVYVTICTNPEYKNDFYIGKHTYRCVNNVYVGSGTNIKRYKKEHPNEYIKLILGTYLTNEEQSQAELYFIRKYFNDPHCLNVRIHSGKGFVNHKHSKISKQKMNFDHSTIEYRQKQSNSHKGKKHSEEQNINQSKKLKGRHWMTDNISEYFVDKEYWGEFIDIGFIFGRKKMK